MAGSSTTCTKIVTLLLLPLFISCHPLYSSCRVMDGVTKNVKFLGESVKHCSENCSSANIDDTCKCLNFNVSQGDCASPGHFIEGLKSLLSNIPSSSIKLRTVTSHLIKAMRSMNETEDCKEKMKECSLLGKTSPKNFHNKLEDMTQRIRSAQQLQ